MKNKYFQTSKWFLPVMLLALLGLAACEPDNDYNDNLQPMRMFMPAGEIGSTSGVEQVRLTWKTLANSQESNVTYAVEVATDTLFQTPVILTAQTDSSGIIFTDEQLQVQQRYYARVKSNASGNRPESKWLYSSRFMIRGQQILLTPGTFDITNNSVVLRWTPNPNVNRIVLTPLVEGGTPVEVQITDADRAVNMKTITGLQPSTGYRAQIFQNNTMRGFLTFRTISGIAGTIVNLAGNTDPGALMEAIANAPSGSTILLPKGATYNISSTVTLDKSITITSELSTDPNLATILFTSNFNVAAGSVIDSVVFRDVVMRSDNYTSRYVMNINNASTMKNMIQGAVAEIFRGIVRLQAAVTVDKFSVINSVIDSVSNYGILAIDNTGATVKDIIIQNSTIYKVERPIVSRTASNTILISNSTFNETPESGRYIIDYSAANNVTNGIRVENSIFGIGKALGTSREGRGIRAGSGTLIEATGSYSTSDRVVTSNAVPGMTTYGKTSFELFQNPKNGNFTIVDPAFPSRNTAGDPRWRP